jgi:serine/threonine protein kinase
LFTEANRGDLQRYLDTHNEDISEDLRLKWCLQAAEAIAYLHSKDVIHSDLRPENYLLHTYNNDSIPDLLLSDFGGSYCKIGDRVIDGGHLPDTGFFNPNNEWVSSKGTDVFALGSVLYTIMTGHWPYKSADPFVSVEEWEEYEDKVNELFMEREYPAVEHLVGGEIIYDCWSEKLDAGTVVKGYKQELKGP